MTAQELEDKSRGLASTVLPERQVEDVIQTIKDLDNVKNIQELPSLLVPDESSRE